MPMKVCDEMGSLGEPKLVGYLLMATHFFSNYCSYKDRLAWHDNGYSQLAGLCRHNDIQRAYGPLTNKTACCIKQMSTI
jgi:hypothetical protein